MAPTPLAACTPDSRPGTTRLSLTSGGVARQYLLTVPPPSGGRLPVVVSLHGYGQSAAQQDSYTSLPSTAASSGVLVVTPEGSSHRWNFVRRPRVGPDDVAFLWAVILQVMDHQCGDPGRLVLTGISDGADMANTLACAIGGAVSWVVSVAASVSPEPCTNPPVRMIEIHGRADPIVPFTGGGGDRTAPFEGTEAQPAAERMSRWARLLNCTTSRELPARADVSRTTWSCPEGRRLELLAVAGGGHTWPGAQPWPAMGATTTSLDATRLVLAAAAGPPSAVDDYLRPP